jgi:hypothetical protein
VDITEGYRTSIRGRNPASSSYARDMANAQGWVIVDMERDWKVVFPSVAEGARARGARRPDWIRPLWGTSGRGLLLA